MSNECVCIKFNFPLYNNFVKFWNNLSLPAEIIIVASLSFLLSPFSRCSLTVFILFWIVWESFLIFGRWITTRKCKNHPLRYNPTHRVVVITASTISWYYGRKLYMWYLKQ